MSVAEEAKLGYYSKFEKSDEFRYGRCDAEPKEANIQERVIRFSLHHGEDRDQEAGLSGMADPTWQISIQSSAIHRQRRANRAKGARQTRGYCSAPGAVPRVPGVLNPPGQIDD